MSTEAENSTPEKKSSMMPKLMVLGFIAMVIIAETVVFFFMVPSADDVAILAEHRLRERLEERMRAENEDVVDDSQSVEEFSFGTFTSNFVPVGSESVYQVNFTLFGLVKKKDMSHLQELYKARENRFSHRLTLEVRNATIDELMDNQLGLIQRRILATTNEILEEPIILGVGFKDYQVFEE